MVNLVFWNSIDIFGPWYPYVLLLIFFIIYILNPFWSSDSISSSIFNVFLVFTSVKEN